MSVIIGDLVPDTVCVKAVPPEIQKAMRIGRMPIADTVPRVYLCGHCRLRRVDEGQGICETCKAMLNDSSVKRGWGAVEWALAAVGCTLLAIALLMIFGIFK